MTETVVQTYNTSTYDQGYLISDADTDGGYHVILTDPNHWAEVYPKLQIWCKDVGADLAGMVIDFKTEQDLLLFILTWN